MNKPLRHEVAMDAASKWVYSPYLMDGAFVGTEVMVRGGVGLVGVRAIRQMLEGPPVPWSEGAFRWVGLCRAACVAEKRCGPPRGRPAICLVTVCPIDRP
jgi:hypothetical protein